jgi:predicted acyltransferase
LASLLFALLIWIIDVNNKKKWSVFFESFGVNPLFIYVLADILSILLSNIVFKFLAIGFPYRILFMRNGLFLCLAIIWVH